MFSYYVIHFQIAKGNVDEIKSTYIISLKMLGSCSAVCMHVPKDGERPVARDSFSFLVKQKFGQRGKQL